MNYALAVPERTRGSSFYGTRAQLAVGNGDVQGFLTLAGCDKRAGTASYALRIVNQSEHPLRARMTCARLRGEPVLAYPLDVQIAPFAISETLLPVRVADVGPYDRAIVQVTGGDVAFSLEAPAPPKRTVRSRWLTFGASAVALTFACAFGAAAATPRVALLAAPARAFTGTSLDVPYTFGGWASMQYSLQTRDGRQLAAGLATAHEGTLHFSVPRAAGRDVVLSVNVAGPFGRQTRTSAIMVAPAPLRKPVNALAAPRIGEFNITTPVVQAGGNVSFTYATNARSGEIWLLDDAGRLWARAPIGTSGMTVVKVPQGTAGRQLRAVLHARNGGADAVASVGLMVLPGALQSDEIATASAAAPAGNPVVTLSSSTAAPGDTITVAIQGKHGETRISMYDKKGEAVEQGDIPASQDVLALTAPAVTGPTTYYVTAAITVGIGEQTVVKKLLVTPR
jgi:hypothetical protein